MLRAPIAGQNHAERAFLAVAIFARYGGARRRRSPAPGSPALRSGRKRARALGLAMRLGCDLSGRSAAPAGHAAARSRRRSLRMTAAAGYADMLLGEQTRRRAKALAEAMNLTLKI